MAVPPRGPRPRGHPPGRGDAPARGPARDAATIFDENAALLVVRDTGAGHALVEDLRAHRWHEVLHARRGRFDADAEVWLFGHALMEKLVAPRKAITAHTRVLFYCHFPDKLLAAGEYIDDEKEAARKRPVSLLKRVYRVPMDWLEEVTTRAFRSAFSCFPLR